MSRLDLVMLGPALPVSFPTPPSVVGDTYSYVDINCSV